MSKKISTFGTILGLIYSVQSFANNVTLTGLVPNSDPVELQFFDSSTLPHSFQNVLLEDIRTPEGEDPCYNAILSGDLPASVYLKKIYKRIGGYDSTSPLYDPPPGGGWEQTYWICYLNEGI